MLIPLLIKNSLPHKLMALFFAVFFCAVFGLTYFAYTSSRNAMFQEFKIRGQTLAKAIASEARTYYREQNVEGLTSLLQSLGEGEDVVAILAYRPSKDLWIEFAGIELTTEDLGFPGIGDVWQRDAVLKKGHNVSEFGNAVLDSSNQTKKSSLTDIPQDGWIRVFLDRRALEQRLNSLIVQTLSVSALTTLFGGILFILLLRRSLHVVAPLTAATKRVALGDLETTVPVSSSDELGELAKCFNSMTEQLFHTTVSKNYVDNVIHSMNDTLIVFNPEGTIRSANRAALDLLGYEEAELLDQDASIIFPPNENPLRGTQQHDLLAQGPIDQLATNYLAKDGRTFPMLFSAAVMRNEDGTIQGIACVAKDITDLKQAEKTIQDAHQKLKLLDRLRSQFFADISHELRTPLTVIRGEAEVTLRGKDKPLTEYKTALGRIVILTNQLNKLVSDLLFLARSEGNSLEIGKQPTPLIEILQEVHREAQILALHRGTVADLAAPTDPLIVEGDPQRLQQLFMILVDNAVNYLKQGGTVEIHAAKSDKDVTVMVADNGMGIPAADLPHVFERFYRVKRQHRSTHPGSGLGLPIAKWITEAHGGTISITSVVDQGTTVTVRLPLSEAETYPIDDEHEEHQVFSPDQQEVRR
ncbi:MAG: PAS domain S-box protein [Nitrospira sp. CG24E]|nr:MAG: PAS domain S-box protein [Nitrospira sp. CG24E]